MASVNKVILLGNVGREPEARSMASGKMVVTLSIATTSKRKDKNTGQTIEDTQWHRVVFYDRMAEIVNEYVEKGQSLYIEGRLKYGKFTDKNGVEKYTTDIVAEEMQMLAKGGGGGGGERRREESRPASAPRPPAAQRPASGGFDDMDDDIPF